MRGGSLKVWQICHISYLDYKFVVLKYGRMRSSLKVTTNMSYFMCMGAFKMAPKFDKSDIYFMLDTANT